MENIQDFLIILFNYHYSSFFHQKEGAKSELNLGLVNNSLS